jgi:predicted DNA-binding transcriptional regulator
MTPKEKAEELLDKMNVIHYRTLVGKKKDMRVPISMYDSQIKQCALIAVDEIINTGLLEGTTTGVLKKYWKEVKQEIEKL